MSIYTIITICKVLSINQIAEETLYAKSCSLAYCGILVHIFLLTTGGPKDISLFLDSDYKINFGMKGIKYLKILVESCCISPVANIVGIGPVQKKAQPWSPAR